MHALLRAGLSQKKFIEGSNIIVRLLLILFALTAASGLCAELDNANYWQQKGDELKENGSLSVALDCYNRSIQLDGTDPSSWMRLGLAYSGLKRYSEALSAYNESIRLKRDQAQAWYFRGWRSPIWAGIMRPSRISMRP